MPETRSTTRPNPISQSRYLRGLVEVFHKYDPTRPVTQALFRPNVSHDYDNGLADLLDVVGQNYREKEILAAYKQKPTRKILGTENTNDLNQWIAMRDNPEYSGQFIWVGVDYLGESAAWPNYAFGKGLLDRTATPRPVGYQRQSWWGGKPMVYIARRVAPPRLRRPTPDMRRQNSDGRRRCSATGRRATLGRTKRTSRYTATAMRSSCF